VDGLQSKVVLVVEDDVSARALVCRALRAKGYGVEEAADGLAASVLLGRMSRPPDLLICDIMMPTVDGFTLARLVRRQSALRSIPIIFLTAQTHADAVISAINLGVRHYVQKPFSLKDLLAKVDQSLRPGS